MELNQCILTLELLLLITSFTHFLKYALHGHKAYKTGYITFMHSLRKVVGTNARESWLPVAVSAGTGERLVERWMGGAI